MAVCNPTHAGPKVQGPGLCCRTMPAAQNHMGGTWVTTDAKGHCYQCIIRPSRSKKNPGKPVFGRGKGLCPTASEGCCSLVTQ